MADLLMRIAQHALGTALPAVKPVIAPLFAQGPSLAASRPEEVTGFANDAIEALAVDERPDGRGRPGIDDPNTIPRVAFEQNPARTAFQSDLKPRQATAVAFSDGVPLPAASDQEQARIQISPPTPVRPTVDARLAHSPGQSQPVQPAQPIYSRPSDVRIQAALSTRPAWISSPGVEGTVPKATHAGIPLASEPREKPTINVTIGRVEVRAVFPGARPAPAAQPVPAHQPITLEQYLRQRNGGRR
jgi:hypothetical protein